MLSSILGSDQIMYPKFFRDRVIFILGYSVVGIFVLSDKLLQIACQQFLSVFRISNKVGLRCWRELRGA
jgi:hypothetical protein